VTRTRAAASAPESRQRFRRYWALMSAGIALIRYAGLPWSARRPSGRHHNSSVSRSRRQATPHAGEWIKGYPMIIEFTRFETSGWMGLGGPVAAAGGRL
jgi:hypothetical protein